MTFTHDIYRYACVITVTVAGSPSRSSDRVWTVLLPTSAGDMIYSLYMRLAIDYLDDSYVGRDSFICMQTITSRVMANCQYNCKKYFPPPGGGLFFGMFCIEEAGGRGPP